MSNGDDTDDTDANGTGEDVADEPTEDSPEASTDEAAEERTEETDDAADGSAEDTEEDGEEEAAEDVEEAGEEEAGEEEAAEDAEEEEDATEEESDDELTEAPTEESLREALTEAEEALEAAETEADLDAVESTLDDVDAGIDAADLPEPDEDDEDADDPRAELESELEALRSDLEEARGPYGEDVVAAIEEAKSTIEDTRWTEQGETEIAEAVDSFTETAAETLDGDFAADDEGQAALLAALDDVAAAVTDAGFDADDDAEEIAALLEATDTLSADLDAAEEWDDLLVNEKLEAQGFYDCLGHYKDFPPEWSALKEWEQRGNIEMILLGLETFDSGFMEEHCLEAITRMGDPGAFDEMHARAQKRGKPAIKALGKMGSDAEEAVETLVEYVDADSDAPLQKVTFKALGEIGSEEATQALANKLVMENDNVRPYAARALGLIGDTRAVDPLSKTLADDESDKVRTAAAWALRQIGTEDALEAVAAYTDEAAFTVQHEAELAAETLASDADAADAADAPTA